MKHIKLETGILSYSKSGSGKEALLLFHGFGQNHQIYDSWVGTLQSTYTLYRFDLFYHGKSTRDLQKLSKAEWQDFIQQFLQKENIGKFSVLGFSLGGRFALTTVVENIKQVNKLFLIAPDAIYLTPWFRICTTVPFKYLFKYFVLRPNQLQSVINTLVKARIINKYIGDFVLKEMAGGDDGKLVYDSWNNFKPLGYTHRDLILNLGKATFPIKVILGDKDTIIHPSKISPILNQIGQIDIIVKPLKHHQLIKPEIAKLML